jgi:hypothetical protein
MPHKYDMGQVSLILFDKRNRIRKTMLMKNYLNAQDASDRWERRTGGTSVVMKCMYNSTQKKSRW